MSMQEATNGLVVRAVIARLFAGRG